MPSERSNSTMASSTMTIAGWVTSVSVNGSPTRPGPYRRATTDWPHSSATIASSRSSSVRNAGSARYSSAAIR